MGRIATVISTERTAEGVDVKCDVGGGDTITAAHVAPPGDDSLPLPGDFAALESSTGKGTAQISGYDDPKVENAKAEDGEVRRYARDSNGVVVCEFYLKKDGTVEITSIKAGSNLNFNGVEIDQQGNIRTPGEITAKANSADAVNLTTHKHLTPMGPSGMPTPEPEPEVP